MEAAKQVQDSTPILRILEEMTFREYQHKKTEFISVSNPKQHL